MAAPSVRHPKIEIVAEKRITGFMSLLTGSGFGVTVDAGCSVRELLCDRLGIRREYLEDRIQTIFLNGKAVDDTETARVEAGCTLTLSAAMPGLVGATFRKGGFYAPMRREISHDAGEGKKTAPKGHPTLKLLNLIQRELGPLLLERGILLPVKTLVDFIRSQPELVAGAVVSVHLDGKPVSTDSLLSMSPADPVVHLIVTFR